MPIFQFRDCGGHILQWIVTKTRTVIQLMSDDFLLGGQRNRK